MKTSLSKKLLKFILPILIIPIVLIVFFFYAYLMHLLKNDTLASAQKITIEKNALFEKHFSEIGRFKEYIQTEANQALLSILDPKGFVLADMNPQSIGKPYARLNDELLRYIQKSLQSKDGSLFHDQAMQWIVKPLLDARKEIIAFTLCDYKKSLEKREAIIFQTFLFLIFIVAILVFITVVLTIIFSYNIINPVKELIKGIQNVTNGNFSHQIKMVSDSEIGVLVDAFNEMVSKLHLSTTVFKNTQEAIIITDAQTTIIDVNKAFTDITGYTKEEALGQKTTMLKSGRHDSSFYADLWNELTNVGHWQGNIWNKKKDGRIYPEWLNISAVRDDEGRLSNFIAVFSDITQLKENEKRLEFLAHHDTLTALPNRLLLNARLEHSINVCKRLQSHAAICFVDLDNFKNINDSYGHNMGDEVLKEAALRLQKLLRDDDTLARIGGDEFVFVFENLHDPKEMNPIAEKILESIGRPFMIEGKEFILGASIGISIYPNDGKSSVALSKNADTAMYVSKNAGKHTYRYYDEAMTSFAMERLVMEAALKNAIAADEMIVYYQPKYDTPSKSIVGLEALVRWQHPTQGLLAPDHFIPLAEETKLIIPIGEIVLRQVCLDVVQWKQEGLLSGRVAVNISGVQINHSDFIQTLLEIFKETQASADMIEIEITETVMMEDPERWIVLLSEIRAIGIHISIDDFGTGYSSLNHLRRLPVDTLKIDRSFVKDLSQDSSADTIASAIISLAQSMGMGTVAEGVETQAQKNFLQSCGCGLHQGFLYAKPICHKDIYQLLKDKTKLD